MNGKVKYHCVLLSDDVILMCRREADLRRMLKLEKRLGPAGVKAVRFWKEIRND